MNVNLFDAQVVIRRAFKMLRSAVWWWAWALLAISTFTVGQNQKPVLISEVDMQNILDEYNSKASEFAHRLTEASWMVATDVGNTSKVNEKVMYNL